MGRRNIPDVKGCRGCCSRVGRRSVGTCGTGSGSVCGRYLSLFEREQIDEFRRGGWTVRAIALALCRSPSTISRELRRALSYRGQYRAFRAQRDAEARARRPRPPRSPLTIVDRRDRGQRCTGRGQAAAEAFYSSRRRCL
ncbi:helix-turn-helix domain-containing protein [Rhodococcus sp. NPDC056960]|uniref:helix-turn-helix domain-containing protein n=1 Tax=Rhodococcus sp. NPDC056960 TaxID=3345982 RepID=UPI003634F1D7